MSTNITNSNTNHANLLENSKIHKIRYKNANLAPSMGQAQKSGSVTPDNRKPIASKYIVFFLDAHQNSKITELN